MIGLWGLRAWQQMAGALDVPRLSAPLSFAPGRVFEPVPFAETDADIRARVARMSLAIREATPEQWAAAWARVEANLTTMHNAQKAARLVAEWGQRPPPGEAPTMVPWCLPDIVLGAEA